MTAFLNLPYIAPLAHAFIDKLNEGGPVCFSDFPKELGMTEDLFHAIADEICMQLATGCVSYVH